jgi:hypothetical protein
MDESKCPPTNNISDHGRENTKETTPTQSKMDGSKCPPVSYHGRENTKEELKPTEKRQKRPRDRKEYQKKYSKLRQKRLRITAVAKNLAKAEVKKKQAEVMKLAKDIDYDVEKVKQKKQANTEKVEVEAKKKVKKKQAEVKEQKEVKRKERDAKKDVKPKERGPMLGIDSCELSIASTVVSKYRQEVVPGRTDPGQYTNKSAKKAGFGDIKIIDDSLPEELKQQLMKCTARKRILLIDHPLIQDLIKLLQNSFYKGQSKCHSRLHFNHANFSAALKFCSLEKSRFEMPRSPK